ncbi:hypothetical protein M8C21_020439, partial [Ambrosia artemisiifolia]
AEEMNCGLENGEESRGVSGSICSASLVATVWSQILTAPSEIMNTIETEKHLLKPSPMAATAPSSISSLLNSLSSPSLSSSPQPTTVSLSSNSSSTKALTISQPVTTPPIHDYEPSYNMQSVMFPSVTFANTLFFKRPYNVQVIVGPDEPEESLIGRFRREECKRRRFFETNQEMRKRKIRDAARRRSRRRQHPLAKKDETPRKKVVDDEHDNWELIDVEVPYCQ